MIAPQSQWAVQIEVTNNCRRSCSNCTRLIAHIRKPFTVSTEQFANSVEALKDFPTTSLPPTTVANKVVGMIGGEPLLHPKFSALVAIMIEKIPQQKHRGLWTGLDWRNTSYARLIESTFGYVNNNLHNTECWHSPILIAIRDVVADAKKRADLIANCWLQRLWSSSITPKGFFFCEVAGSLDWVFDGPGGLPVKPNCWKQPLDAFRSQIDCWCQRCGIPLNLKGRQDKEEVDDISPSNLAALQDSPAIQAGRYVLHNSLDPKPFPTETAYSEQPWKYLQ